MKSIYGAYLITGAVGSGKSTVAKHLTDQGYTAIDQDHPTLCHYQDLAGTRVPITNYQDGNASWLKAHRWVIGPKQLHAVLNTYRESQVFIATFSANQAEFYNLFSKIFYLEVSVETALKRMANTADRTFGIKPFQQQWALEKYQPLRNEMEAIGATFINGETSSGSVAAEILSYAATS